MISITMQCRIIILPFCSADSATKRAARRGRRGRGGECCEQVRGECVNIAPGRIEKQMSNENRNRGESVERGVQQGVERVAEVRYRQAGHAHTLQGGRRFGKLASFRPRGRSTNGRRTDGRRLCLMCTNL